ncbi:MAG: hypothetical protein OXG79_11160 [Chloroflexi bacterium]|nr:hypothetical protein [Chloroflexota bacterium]
MTPDSFIAKWQAVDLKENAVAQSHFNDLGRMLGEPTPVEADPTGQNYCFERGARKDSGSDGWAADISEEDALWELLELNRTR